MRLDPTLGWAQPGAAHGRGRDSTSPRSGPLRPGTGPMFPGRGGPPSPAEGWAAASLLGGGRFPPAGRTVASKISAILIAFTDGGEHSVTEVVRVTRLPMSTTHRLMSELVSLGLLERTPEGKYRTGPQLRMRGHGDVQPVDLGTRAPRVLEDLAGATGCHARLGVLQDLAVAHIDHEPGPRPVSAFSAARLPAHATALGRALLAFAPPATVQAVILRGLPPYTSFTITSPERLRRALSVVRTTCVAVARFELDITTCGVAVPVFGRGGEAVAAIELTLPDLGQELQRVLGALVIATRSLSREIVHVPGTARGCAAARAGADPTSARSEP